MKRLGLSNFFITIVIFIFSLENTSVSPSLLSLWMIISFNTIIDQFILTRNSFFNTYIGSSSKSAGMDGFDVDVVVVAVVEVDFAVRVAPIPYPVKFNIIISIIINYYNNVRPVLRVRFTATSSSPSSPSSPSLFV